MRARRGKEEIFCKLVDIWWRRKWRQMEGTAHNWKIGDMSREMGKKTKGW